MKKTRYVVVAIVAIIIVTAFFVHDNNKFTISDIAWGYNNKGIFNVSFLVHNDAKRELSNKLVIRAYKDKYIGKAIVTDLIGEERVSATLLPGEQQIISEKMNLIFGLLPDKVLVSAIAVK